MTIRISKGERPHIWLLKLCLREDRECWRDAIKPRAAQTPTTAHIALICPPSPLFCQDQMSRNDQEDAFFASPSHVSKTDCCLNLRGKDRADDFEGLTTKGFLFQGDAGSDMRMPASGGNTFDMLDVTKRQWAIGHRYHRENL